MTTGQHAHMQERVNDFNRWVSARAPQIARIAAPGVEIEQVVANLMALGRQNPDVYFCSFQSLLYCVTESARLGLDLGSSFDHLYIVPFRNAQESRRQGTDVKDATLIIGYKGLIELAERSGRFSAVYARLVYQQDHFEEIAGTEVRIDHRPVYEGSREKDDIRLVYAVAKRAHTGEAEVVILTPDDIAKAQASSRGAERSDSPWQHPEHFKPMWLKTAIRRLFSQLPIGGPSAMRLERALQLEQHHETAPDHLLATPPEVLPSTGAGMAAEAAVAATPPTEELPAGEPPIDEEPPPHGEAEAPPEPTTSSFERIRHRGPRAADPRRLGHSRVRRALCRDRRGAPGAGPEPRGGRPLAHGL